MSKSFKQFLLEAPLPEDWDSAIFNPRIPFTKRVKYAKDRASKLGAGSSRIAFAIPYEGRQTVLKVAKNAKGAAQNEEEATLFGDWYLKNLGIAIPMIDFDESNSQPTWIHTEFANKAKKSDFVKACGAGLEELVLYAELVSGRKQNSYKKVDQLGIDEDSDLAQAMVDFVGNYTHVPTGDLYRMVNWGVYNDKPVIIDLGLTDTSLVYYR